MSYNVHGQLNCEGGFHFRKEVVDVSTYETLVVVLMTAELVLHAVELYIGTKK